jgi:hypothetical protein
VEEFSGFITWLRSLGVVVNPAVAAAAGAVVFWVRKKTTLGDPTKAARRGTIALTWGVAIVLVVLLDLAGRGDSLVWTVEGTAEAILSWAMTAALAAGGAGQIKGWQGK